MTQNEKPTRNHTFWFFLLGTAVLVSGAVVLIHLQHVKQENPKISSPSPAYDYPVQEGEKAIDRVVLFSDSGVTITALALGFSSDQMPYIVTAVENTCEVEIIPQVSYCAINGVAMHTYMDMDQKVSAGETSLCHIQLDDPFFTYVGFTQIENLQIELSFCDAATAELLSTDTHIHEITFSYDYEPFHIEQLSGALTLDTEGDYKIYYAGSSDLNSDHILDFVFYIECSGTAPIYFESGDLFVNDIMQSDYAFGVIAPGNGSFVSVSCDDDSMHEHGISDAAIQFTFFDENYNLVYESEVLSFIGTPAL